MDILIVYLIASFLPLVSLGWKACPQSIPTVSYVSRCPANSEEWKSAAAKKGCRAVGMNQSCSDDGSFEYHCVLNEDGTKLMEVCAPIWYMSGYCARFSIASKRIINNPDLDCSAFDTPCPARFPSNESFKYQMCYKKVRDTMVHDCMDKMGYGSNNTIGMPSAIRVEREKANNPVLVAFLALFIIIALCLLILLIYGKRLKNMICRRDEYAKQKDSNLETDALMDECRNVNEVMTVPLTDEAPIDTGIESNAQEDKGPTVVQETSEGTPQQKPMNEDPKDLTEIVSLSRSIEERVSLKDVESIGDLREKLCTKLDYPIELLWIVHKETGTIYKDDCPINASTKATYTLMLGNKKRADGSNEDGRKYKKSIRSQVKCRMDCEHWTDAETLLQLIRDTLPETIYTELKCPLCSKVWEEQELVEKCKMSDDERIFFDRVLEVNRKTKNFFKETLRNERQNKTKDDSKFTFTPNMK